MWSKKIVRLTRFQCYLVVIGLVFANGLCQNAEPSLRLKSQRDPSPRLQDDENIASTSTNRPFKWDASPGGKAPLDEEKSLLDRDTPGPEVAPGGNGNKDRALFSPSPSGQPALRQHVDVTTVSTIARRKGRTNKGHKKRRRNKASKLAKIRSRIAGNNSTISTDVIGRNVRTDTMDIKLNQIKSAQEGHVEKMLNPYKDNNNKISREKRLKQARERRRKIRMERRRRRNREKRRKNKEKQNGDKRGKPGQTRKQRKMNDAPAALFLGKFENPDTNDTGMIIENFPNITMHKKLHHGKLHANSTKMSDHEEDEPLEKPFPTSINPDPSNITIPRDADESLKTSVLEKRNQVQSHDNVEREFSKHFEKEFSKKNLNDADLLSDDNRSMKPSSNDSVFARNVTRKKFRTVKPSRPNKTNRSSKSAKNSEDSLTNSLERSRFDGEKMLGYSKSGNELPNSDMENDVLSKTLRDYNDYVTSSLKSRFFETSDQHPIYGIEALQKNSFADNKNFTVAMADTPTPYAHGDLTFLYHPPSVHDKSSSEATAAKAERRDPEDTRDNPAALDGGNLKGDLSCINGTFLPAPLARHALIKYVKSSAPGHEYLEADYECTPGFSMTTSTNRLLCKNRRWIGSMPNCKLRHSPEGACAGSPCEQFCQEVDGKAKCSCYKGFRQNGHRCIDIDECKEANGGCEYKCVNTLGSYRCECPKGMRQGEERYTCMDINECLLNNGHGPCQDTCRNLEGGYHCFCDGLPGTTLSSDNHTCQDAGPCGVNNAGCSHTCLSTMGRVFCLCPDGFMLEDDWKTCQDVDECAVPDLQTEVCQYGCINTPGSYRCAEPLELRDQPIPEPLMATCAPGYEASEDGSCIDIDECLVDNGQCFEVCINTDGSYFCACNGDEKVLSSDGKTCVDINNVACPPLNPDGRGYLMCSRLTTPRPWRGRRRVINRPGTKCYLKCPHGYQLRGEYELTCGADGSWDGPKHGECVRYSKPRLDCPKDVVAEVSPGQTEAFVSFGQPSTDLDWFRYVHSEPSWGTRLEANLKPGLHKVTFFARHPVSKKQTSCVLRIDVQNGESPRIKDCPDNIEVTGKNNTIVTWAEPIFTDNVKVVHITSSKSSGRLFPIGQHKIEYEARDEAGWSAKCDFTVTIRRE